MSDACERFDLTKAEFTELAFSAAIALLKSAGVEGLQAPEERRWVTSLSARDSGRAAMRASPARSGGHTTSCGKSRRRWYDLRARGGLVLTSPGRHLAHGCRVLPIGGNARLEVGRLAGGAGRPCLRIHRLFPYSARAPATDTDETARQQIAETIKIAKAEQLEAKAQLLLDKAAVKRNCDVWRSICDKAKADQRATEKKLAERARCSRGGGSRSTTAWPGGSSAYLPFVTRSRCSFTSRCCCHSGLRSLIDFDCHRRGGSTSRSLTVGTLAQTTRRRAGHEADACAAAGSSSTPLATAASDEIDPQPVVNFLKRKLPAARGPMRTWLTSTRGLLRTGTPRVLRASSLTPAQSASSSNYICKEAGIRIDGEASEQS